MRKRAENLLSRRTFAQLAGAGAALTLARLAAAAPKIQGFEEAKVTEDIHKGWKPVSDRKVRVGIAGFGVCQFGAAFYFQNHPNVEVAAVTDLFPDRCAALAKICRCDTTYPSCEEMIEKDKKIEAVFIATDAPSHARLAIMALNRGLHVASAVPAVWGSLEDADKLFEAVKKSGRHYMMFETSYFHEDLYAWRQIYRAGGFGKLIYTEGEYYHYMPTPIDSYKGWRVGAPPQFYPTHSNAYYVGVTGGSFTEVCCMAIPSIVDHLKPENNPYKNPFGTEVALFRTSEGGMARMAVSWDTPFPGGEMGRIRAQKNEKVNVNTKKPPLPPGVQPGGHGGSHGYLMCEFVESILLNRKPEVDIAKALNMTVAGIVAHHSALKDGELMKIPQYKL